MFIVVGNGLLTYKWYIHVQCALYILSLKLAHECMHPWISCRSLPSDDTTALVYMYMHTRVMHVCLHSANDQIIPLYMHLMEYPAHVYIIKPCACMWVCTLFCA